MQHCLYQFLEQQVDDAVTSQVHIHDIARTIQLLKSQIAASLVTLDGASRHMVNKRTLERARHNLGLMGDKGLRALLNQKTHDARAHIAHFLVRVCYARHHLALMQLLRLVKETQQQLQRFLRTD